MEIALQDKKGGVQVSDALFGKDFNPSLVHQLVTAYMAGGRAGTKAQKNRAAVSGGGKKPWRQKGTGRARAGTTRGPIWRGGGVTFAATPRNYSQKLNRKMYRAGMRSILSELLRQERLVAVSDFSLAEPKTKGFVAAMKKLGITEPYVTIITAETDANVALAARNVPGVVLLDAASLNPVDLVGAEKVIVTEAAVKLIEESLA